MLNKQIQLIIFFVLVYCQLSNELRYMEMHTIPDKLCFKGNGDFVCTREGKIEEGCYPDGGMNGNIIL